LYVTDPARSAVLVDVRFAARRSDAYSPAVAIAATSRRT
jgi:hypothetical protein